MLEPPKEDVIHFFRIGIEVTGQLILEFVAFGRGQARKSVEHIFRFFL
jgi:hypothetical protein